MRLAMSDRTRTTLLAIVGAVVFFMAGVGTGSVVVLQVASSKLDKIGSLAGGLAGSPGRTQGPPAQDQADPTPQGSASPDDDSSDLRAWATEQGLPETVPEQYLPMLRQRFPEGIPADVVSRISQMLGGS